MSFEKLLNELIIVVDSTNTFIIDRITDPEMKYEWLCIKPDLTYDAYYSMIKPKWDCVIDNFVSQSDICDSVFKLINLKNISDLSELLKSRVIKSLDISDPAFQQRLQDIAFEQISDMIISNEADIYMDANIVKTIYNF